MVTSTVQEPCAEKGQKSEREKEGEQKKEVGAEKREQVRKSDLLNVGLENVSQKGSAQIHRSGSAGLSFCSFFFF